MGSELICPTEPWKCSGIGSAEYFRRQPVKCVCVCVKACKEQEQGDCWKSVKQQSVSFPSCHPHAKKQSGSPPPQHWQHRGCFGGTGPEVLDPKTPEIEESEDEMTDLKQGK